MLPLESTSTLIKSRLSVCIYRNMNFCVLMVVGCVGVFGCNAVEISFSVNSNPVFFFANVEMSCFRPGTQNVNHLSWMKRNEINATFDYIVLNKKSLTPKKYLVNSTRKDDGLEYRLTTYDFDQSDAVAEFKCEIGLKSKTVNLSKSGIPLFSLPNKNRVFINKSDGIKIEMKELLPIPECKIKFKRSHKKINLTTEVNRLTYNGWFHVPETYFNDTCTPFTVHCETEGVDKTFNLNETICKGPNTEGNNKEGYGIYICFSVLFFIIIGVVLSIGKLYFYIKKKAEAKQKNAEMCVMLANSQRDQPLDN